MGDNSFGKGLIQAVYGLKNGAGLVVTVAQYITPGGTEIQGKGIVNSISMNFVPQEAAIQEQTETAIFAGGCFWCTEAVFQEVKGVEKVVSGYSGGNVPGIDADARRMSRIKSAESGWPLPAIRPMFQITCLPASRLVVPINSRLPLRCSAAIFLIISSLI